MSEELSLSEELRRAREARDESLEQVHQRTGIALTILQELESGDYTVVEPVYARLAINHYASHLGLDGHAFETRLREEVADTRPPPVEMRTASQAQVQPLQTPSPVAEFIRSQPPSRLATIGVILVVGLAILLYLLGSDAPDPRAVQRPAKGPPPVSAANNPEAARSPTAQTLDQTLDQTPDQAPDQTPDQAPVAQVPAAPQPARSEPTPESDPAAASLRSAEPQPTPRATQDVSARIAATSAPAPELAATASSGTVAATPDSVAAPVAANDVTVMAGPLQLQVDALDSTWVQVQWDDEDGIVEIIPRGERRIWGAERFFMVRAGRAHGVHFHFQGELLADGRLGDPTKVLRFRASTEGVQLLGPDLEPIGAVTAGTPISDPSQPESLQASTPQPDIVEAAVQDRP